MSDTSPTDQRALQHNSTPPSERQPKPGEEAWRLRDNETGRVQSCELRNNSATGAGWEVMLLENGDLLFSRHCENERIARYVADAARKDLLRTGSTEENGPLPSE